MGIAANGETAILQGHTLLQLGDLVEAELDRGLTLEE